MNDPTSTVAAERFDDGVHRGDDFPYYDGKPVDISGPQWCFVMFMTLLGFLVMIAPLTPFSGGFGQFIPAFLFFAIPLASLAVVAGQHWTAIFRPVKVRDIGWMIAFALLNMAITLPVGWLVLNLFGAEPNPAIAGLADRTTPERVLFILKTAPSLFGEEVMSILSFLAMLYFFHSRAKLGRTASILCAWLGSALLFGLAHLPTYNWDLVQCVVVIGTARLVLSLPYMKTKNIWVSTGAHILNDWTFFGLTILGASLSRG